jgi:PAS domain-containing protein
MPQPKPSRASETTPSDALRLNGLDALFHGHPDGVCVVDVDGTFVECNRALVALTGYTPSGLPRLHAGEVQGGARR